MIFSAENPLDLISDFEAFTGQKIVKIIASYENVVKIRPYLRPDCSLYVEMFLSNASIILYTQSELDEFKRFDQPKIIYPADSGIQFHQHYSGHTEISVKPFNFLDWIKGFF